MRPKHYMKNGLILIPLIFSGQLLEVNLLTQVLWAVVVFSLLASVVYIVNDIRDVKKDQLHPKKKFRPIASGAVPLPVAYGLAILLIAAAVAIGIVVGLTLTSWIILGIYFAINVAYSFGLKNIPIVDVAILASGFILRVIYGGEVVNIDVSQWLYMTILAGAFYLALGKRRNEIITNGAKSRKVNEYYSLNFLDKNMYVCLALLLVFYSLWATDPARGDSLLYLTIPLILLVFMTYSLSIEKQDSSGDPVDVVLGHKPLLGLIAVYVIVTVGLVYL